jgi:hypothetical protein
MILRMANLITTSKVEIELIQITTVKQREQFPYLKDDL